MPRYKELFLKNYKRYFFYIVLFKCAVLLLLFAGSLFCHAQGAASTQNREFHIASQPVGEALSAYTRASGIDLLYGTRLPSGARSNPVDGVMPVMEALSKLLTGTGLTFRVVDAHTVRLEEAPKAQAGVTQLGTLRVQGSEGSGGISGEGIFGDVGPAGNREFNKQSEKRPYVTPGSSAYISSDQINRVPPTTIGDIFKNTAGVLSAGNRQSSGLNINIRGLQGMNRINVLVDGTQQTNSQYIGYHGNTSSVYIDPDFISGVDISKGPNGGQYGSGAMGGVVNMRTLDATDIVEEGHKYGIVVRGGLANGSKTPQLESQVPRNGNPSAFNGDAYRGSVSVGAILDRYNIVAGVARRKTGNYFAGNSLPQSWGGTSPGPGGGASGTIYSAVPPGGEAFNTSQDEVSGMLKMRTHFGNGHSLELGYMNYYDKHGELNDYFLIYSTLLPTVQGDLAITRTHTGSLRYGYFPDGNKWVHFRANVWGTRLQTYHSPQYLFGSGVQDLSNYNYPVTSVGTETWNTSEIPTKLGQLNLKYGMSFSQENATGDVTVYSNGSTTYPVGDPSGKRYLGSIFSQVNFKPRSWIIVDGGLRVDRYHGNGHSYFESFPVQNHNRLNGNLGITAEPWHDIQFFGIYTRGWRPPALREAYWQYTDLVIPNRSLKPETSDNFEFGGNIERSNLFLQRDHAQLKVAYFSNRYGNYIGRESLAGNGTLPYSWINLDKAEYRGIEAQGTYGIPQLFAQGGYTKYTYITYCMAGQPCSGAALSNDYGGGYVPPSYAGNGTIGTNLLHNKLAAGFTANYWSGRAPVHAASGSDSSHAYVPPASWPKAIIMSAYATYKVADHFDLGASGENLGNRYYLDPLSIAFLPSPGRIVRLNATIRF